MARARVVAQGMSVLVACMAALVICMPVLVASMPALVTSMPVLVGMASYRARVVAQGMPALVTCMAALVAGLAGVDSRGIKLHPEHIPGRPLQLRHAPDRRAVRRPALHPLVSWV